MFKRTIHLVLLAFSITAVAVPLANSCNLDAGKGAAGVDVPTRTPAGVGKAVKVRDRAQIRVVAILPADAPGNPYAGQHEVWDRWMQANLVDADQVDAVMEANPTYSALSAYVDQDGYLVPQLAEERRQQEMHKVWTDTDPLDGFTVALAAGSMPPGLLESLNLELDKLASEYYPPIPEWVSSALPCKAVLLPEGYVAALNGLGSWRDGGGDTVGGCGCGGDGGDKQFTEDGYEMRAPEHWVLYGPSGDKLIEGDRPWWPLMYEYRHGNHWPEGRAETVGRYTEFSDADSGAKRMSVWDWDATQLPENWALQPYDMHNYMVVDAEQMKKLLAVRSGGEQGGAK